MRAEMILIDRFKLISMAMERLQTRGRDWTWRRVDELEEGELCKKWSNVDQS